MGEQLSLLLFICLLLLSVFLQAFFTGSEIALVKANKRLLKIKASQGSAYAKRSLKLIQQPSWFFATTLLGQNICAIFTTTLITFYIMQHLGKDYEFFAILFIPITLLFAEILPKSLFLLHADKLAPTLGSILLFVSYILFVPVYLLSSLGKIFLSKIKDDHKDVPNREELDAIVENSESSQGLGGSERWIIRRIFDISEKTVQTVMTPQVKIQALEQNTRVAQALELFANEEFSKMPIFSERIFNITGYVVGFDILKADPEDPVYKYARNVEFIPESMALEDLILKLPTMSSQMMVVVDEYGGAVGIMTREDIFEELIGEIDDEYDIKDEACKRIAPNRFLVKASMEIASLQDQLGIDFPEGEFATLSGFLLDAFGKIPKVGDLISLDSYTYVIRKASPRHIEEVEIVGRFNQETNTGV